MAHIVGNKVLVKLTNPGTGAFILPSLAENGRVHPSFWSADGDTTYYQAEATDGSGWEEGVGTFSATGNGQISRDTVLATSAGSSSSTKLNFTGEIFLYVELPRDKRALLDPYGYLIDGRGEYHAREKVLTDTGAADAYVVASGIQSYKAGQILRVLIVNANTGAATLDAGQGARAIKRADGSDPAAGEIPAGLISFIDDGTQYRILAAPSAGGLSRGADTALSGASVSWTGLPAGLDQITLSIDGASLSGAGWLELRLGDSGGVETTGYVSLADGAGGVLGSSTAFVLSQNVAAAAALYGSVTLTRRTGNVWTIAGSLTDGSAFTAAIAGRKTLSGELDRIELLASAGSFDAGNANILYQ